jgi:hypothetical protein
MAPKDAGIVKAAEDVVPHLHPAENIRLCLPTTVVSNSDVPDGLHTHIINVKFKIHA